MTAPTSKRGRGGEVSPSARAGAKGAALASPLRYVKYFSFRRALKVALLAAGRLSQKVGGDESAATTRLRRWFWTVNRGSRSNAFGKLRVTAEFDAVLARVAAGGSASAEELLPFLCLEEREQRWGVNALLAEAYAQSETPAHTRQARVFAERAWLLSRFSSELLPLYVRILSAAGDTAAVREAYKRAGIKSARAGQIAEALWCFDRWQYAYHELDKLDRFEFDFDILASVEELAAPYREELNATRRGGDDKFAATTPAATMTTSHVAGERMRLAYLLKGITETNSILVRVCLSLAEHHDKSRFDVTFYVPESRGMVLNSPQGREHVAAFERAGCRVLLGPDSDDAGEVLLNVAREIREAGSHLLVAGAALASFGHYFVTCLRSAPAQVGLLLGPPPQYAPPTLDWCVAWSRHPLMDCPVGCTFVAEKLLTGAEDEPAGAPVYSKSQLGLPEAARVLLSGGRHTKFQEPLFWRAVVEVLALHPEAFYLVVGARDEEIPFLDSVVPAEVRPRVRCLGWREDFQAILHAADVVVDTYPSGGGQVLVQAAARGVPVVAHRNDYMTPFDQTNWSPAEDFIADPELIIPRGDFGAFERVVSRLIADEAYRAEAGERCRRQAARDDVRRGVRRCEEIYAEVVARVAATRAAGAGDG